MHPAAAKRVITVDMRANTSRKSLCIKSAFFHHSPAQIASVISVNSMLHLLLAVCDDISRDLCLLPEENRGVMLRAGQSGVSCPRVQLKVLLQLLKTMVCVCASPNCKNRMSRNNPYSFHRLHLSDSNMLKLWLIVLQLDANTPVQTLRLADHRVCSAHFSQDDYCQPKKRRHPIPKHFTKHTSRKQLSHSLQCVFQQSKR